MSSTLSAHASFTAIRSEHIPSLNLTVEHYEHTGTGAVHYHLAAENQENVFLVALRTVPQDSTGVAHILEHTALCGSKRYPVRDPFFMMLRRSLNTFMNAFTSSDWTAYPFASQNRKDFNNLLDVYLDAVFFSRLDPLDFAQEGHRVEFEPADDPSGKLVYKGVVFNEMKGAMSSVTSVLWDKLCYHLFPDSTYHYNSGGDPACIPDLSYEQLLAFYRSHYHPSNATFMTFGDIPAAQHQARFEERALSQFQRLDQRIAVAAQTPMAAPLRCEEAYALDDAETADKTHIVIGWMLGESSDLQAMLEAQLLSSVLIDNSASVLMHALETTDLGQAPSPLCGLEDSMRELVFCCGLEGSEAEHAQAVEELVVKVIDEVATAGVSQQQLEAVLHQLELHQREISGDSYPYGLQLILQALGCATHYADPIAVLDLDPVIDRLREQIRDPNYIRDLAKRLLLDNPHRVTLVLKPDTELAAKRVAAEEARLLQHQQSLDDTAKAHIVDLAKALEQRQQQVDDDSVLPRVELSDVPQNLPELEAQKQNCGDRPLTQYAQGTNGLVYQQLICPLPRLSDDDIAVLPYYTHALTELGLGDADYLAVQKRQAAEVGAINAFTSMRGAVDDEQDLSAYFVLSSKALANNSQAQSQLMADTLYSVKFTELDRLKDLVSQQRARREQAVTSNGHGLAMTAACAGMSPLAKMNHQLSGLAGLKSLRELDKSLANSETQQQFADQLIQLHSKILQQPQQLLAIAEAEQLSQVSSALSEALSAQPQPRSTGLFSCSEVKHAVKELWLTNTQVNFCAKAYPTVPVDHPDAPALTVLGGFLRNGFLHRAIREQGGAYGGGASQDSGIAAFRFYSYRDPRLSETLSDFDQSLQWLLSEAHSPRALEEAILGVIGSLDKPSSPAGEAKQHFHNGLFGRTHQQREAFRRSILEVNLDELKRVTGTYLRPELASTVAITSAAARQEMTPLAQELGLSIQEL